MKSIFDECRGMEAIYHNSSLNRRRMNLFHNSLNHGEKVAKFLLSVSRTKTAIIGVKDNGIGIPVAMKKAIFEKGVGKNTVFGLFLLRSILSITCLDIDETGIEGEDSKFIITISHGDWRSGVSKNKQSNP